MANLGPETMCEFFGDIDKLEKLALDEVGIPEQVKKKKSASQTYVEYLRLQKQNYDDPDNKPVAQAYKTVSDSVAQNQDWARLPRFENVMLRKSLMDYATS